MTNSEKIALVARLQGELLRDVGSGHPEWYGEMLFAAAYDGKLAKTNQPKYDMETNVWGRLQVKVRVDGTDTTQNRANFGKYTVGDFEHAAIILFSRNYRIDGAVVLPCSDMLSLVRPAGHVKWSDAKAHRNSLDVTSKLREISGE